MNYRLSALAFCAVFAVASVSQASLGPLQVKIDDGINTAITAIDQGLNDANSVDGSVTLVSALGDWSTNVSTGISAPEIGTDYVPSMDLNSVNVSSSGAGTMKISFTGKYLANDPIIGGFTHSIGGTTQGSIVTSLYIGTSAFDENTLISTMTPALSGVSPTLIFADQTQGSAAGTDTEYWLTLTATVTHTGSGSSSFNAAVDSIPEPASIAIWTLMAGIGGLIWMRRKSK